MTLASDYRAMLAHYREQVALTETDYAAAARRRAQTQTMWGAFIGLGGLAVLLIALGVVAWAIGYSPLDTSQVAEAFGCAAAGALGACTSVSWKVLTFGELQVDLAASVLTVRGLGAVRPFVGAIFGVAAYFALKSNFINIGSDSFYFLAFIAFVAGFSERFVPDLIRKAEETPA
jgi:hypothetical protein